MKFDIDYKMFDKPLRQAIFNAQRRLNVKVGILGANGKKGVKGKDGKTTEFTMASLGAVHEYGSINGDIPSRSFLRMPIDTRFLDELEANKGFKEAVKSLDVVKMNNEAGLTAKTVIDDAFDTGGWGDWKKLSDITVKRKGSDSILIDTGNLRRSITYEVLE